MVDASSKFQDSLPISSDELLKTLDQWNIKYNLFEHVPLRTVEDSKKYKVFLYLLKMVEVMLKIYI